MLSVEPSRSKAGALGIQKGQPNRWSNWSGIVTSAPRDIVYPSSIEEVRAIVQSCAASRRSLRVVGAGHSFTALAATNDVLMSLDRMSGIIEINHAEQTALVWAGTRLHDLGPLLWKHGLAQENLGDIDAQSIAGAISTGTHGTGSQFGILATQVIEITAVLGTGEVVTCSAESSPELFRALQVSLGAIGVIVKMRLQCKKAFQLHYESRRVRLNDCLTHLEEYKENFRQFEFYCFPYSDTVQLKLMTETETPATHRPIRDYFNKVVMENWLFGALSTACKSMPSLCRPVSRLSASSVPVSEEVGPSYSVFATPRLVRFNEMEYNIPAEALPDVVREVLAKIEAAKIPVHFPIECRFAHGDNIPLSPANSRESAYVAVHMYKGMPHEPYFRAVEEIFLRYGGRPHWGKLHTLTSTELSTRYPAWGEFLTIRASCDPAGIFLNSYLRTLFGLPLLQEVTDHA
ncbi:D-arabinono-1,4-lactone oxidase [Alicyclobacillus ferrooxydans]|uniref:FAD-binding oxidoreductase n=1 Tax=Alicyclobacillus ferrooxydans TaxID=471514 RepID=A0A0P9EPU7_9BACL|nr:D-arabinono-1,4-lactone oxidase [Alicyclobacillus ferrooxydans]KPV45527.1 FAD-binding oxidoreductase [Alicyclobacillus ferrooxydans]